MAGRDAELFKSLRDRGLRKKTADQVARATNGGAEPKLARRASADLASVVEEINDRLREGPQKRSAAASKAARTRKQKARKRSEAAARGARTKART